MLLWVAVLVSETFAVLQFPSGVSLVQVESEPVIALRQRTSSYELHDDEHSDNQNESNDKSTQLTACSNSSGTKPLHKIKKQKMTLQ